MGYLHSPTTPSHSWIPVLSGAGARRGRSARPDWTRHGEAFDQCHRFTHSVWYALILLSSEERLAGLVPPRGTAGLGPVVSRRHRVEERQGLAFLGRVTWSGKLERQEGFVFFSEEPTAETELPESTSSWLNRSTGERRTECWSKKVGETNVSCSSGR